jgi:hypothetical protein
MTEPDRAAPVAPADGTVASSRRARIWKRTWYGAGLALATAVVLWLAHVQRDARPVLFAGGFVALLAALEASLMGKLFLRGLPVILVVPLVGVCLSESASLKFPPAAGPAVQLLLEVLLAASLAALVHLLTRGLSRQNLPRQVLILGLCVLMVGAFSWLDDQGQSPSEHIVFFAAVAGVLAVAALFHCRTKARRLDLAISVGLAVWIAVPLPALAQVERLWDTAGLVSLMVLSKVGDIAASASRMIWLTVERFMSAFRRSRCAGRGW